MTKRTYRPEIDGLRAVAVLLVLVYHLFPHALPGGYTGVDIFFVISGYVVTGSVFDFPAMGRLAAAGLFWRRRILRILPALLAMVLGALTIVAVLVPPFPRESYVSYVRSAAFALAGASNFYFYRGRLDYFTADQTLNPFLHTWSLAVEEQFYLTFLVVFLLAIGPPKAANGRTWLGVMSALGIGSYVAFRLAAESNPLAAYYFVTSRFWEIAAGSCLSILTRMRANVDYSPSRRKQAAAIAALAAAAALPGEENWLVARITIAVAATALLMFWMKESDGFSGSMLSQRWCVETGKTSYSIYLWHVPVFVVFRLSVGTEGLWQAAAALAVTAALALASRSLIEEPFRRSNRPFGTQLAPVLAACAGLILAAAMLTEKHAGALYAGRGQEWAGDWMRARELAYADQSRITWKHCDLGPGAAIPVSVPVACSTVSSGPGARPLLFLIGDSHAYSAWGMAVRAASLSGLDLATIAHDGCSLAGLTERPAASCSEYWRRMPAMVKATVGSGGVVAVSVFWLRREERHLDAATEHLEAIASAARERGAALAVEAPLPVFSKPSYLCTQEWYRSDYSGCFVNRKEAEAARAAVMRRLTALAARNPNVRIWDPLPVVCPGETCPALLDGKPLFRDRNHLSHYGSVYLGPFFSRFLNGIGGDRPTLAQAAPPAFEPTPRQ